MKRLIYFIIVLLCISCSGNEIKEEKRERSLKEDEEVALKSETFSMPHTYEIVFTDGSKDTVKAYHMIVKRNRYTIVDYRRIAIMDVPKVNCKYIRKVN